MSAIGSANWKNKEIRNKFQNAVTEAGGSMRSKCFGYTGNLVCINRSRTVHGRSTLTEEYTNSDLFVKSFTSGWLSMRKIFSRSLDTNF